MTLDGAESGKRIATRRHAMEPLVMILIPGTLGGLALALLLPRLRGRTRVVVPHDLEPASPTLINMAHIRVEGVGGLGLVAAVLAVAAFDSRIRLAILIAAALGTALALAMIGLRRSTGALPSGTNGPDGGLPLGLDRGPVAARIAEQSGRSARNGAPRLSVGSAAALRMC